MSDVKIECDIEEMIIQLFGVISKNNLSIDIAYYLFGTALCRLALILDRPVEQIIKDIESTFRPATPQIVEEN